MIFSFQNASFRDAETGLYNQAYFMEVFNHEWHRLIRAKANLSFLLLNPHVNLSNKTEKQNFIKIASLLKQQTYRSSDIICRFDDNIFAIGLFDLNKQGTDTIVERFQQKIKETLKPILPGLNLTIGAINVLPSGAISVEDIFEQTEQMLIESEHQGSNSYSIRQLH